MGKRGEREQGLSVPSTMKMLLKSFISENGWSVTAVNCTEGYHCPGQLRFAFGQM